MTHHRVLCAFLKVTNVPRALPALLGHGAALRCSYTAEPEPPSRVCCVIADIKTTLYSCGKGIDLKGGMHLPAAGSAPHLCRLLPTCRDAGGQSQRRHGPVSQHTPELGAVTSVTNTVLEHSLCSCSHGKVTSTCQHGGGTRL